jgi:hypothetical protein
MYVHILRSMIYSFSSNEIDRKEHSTDTNNPD